MEQPNIVLIVADDVCHHDLPVYGGTNVKTPAIDRLASEGTVFSSAYLALSMCMPCRTELYTGLYPVRNGCCWNHSAARPGTRSAVHHLRELGYRVGLAGKQHVSPADSFPFESVPGLTSDCCAVHTEFDPAGIRAFMEQDARRPFCLVVGLVEAHVPWTMGDLSHFDPDTLALPPYLADTPETRRDFAKYLAEIEVLDNRLGATLQSIEDCGCAETTLVIFTSEQGYQFPGGKWTNWDAGIHTGFVVRWPGHVPAGRRTDALIQYADVLPTLIEACGGDPSDADMDGTSFLRVLVGQSDVHRRYAYAMHNNIPEGPPYPIRAITDGSYHYIRNLRHEALYIEQHVMGPPKWHDYWSSWLARATFDAHTERCVRRYMRRSREELYDVSQDPFEINNLAGDPHHDSVRRKLRSELDLWMAAQGDPGASIDTEAQWKAAKAGRHFEPQSPHVDDNAEDTRGLSTHTA
jgi:uncharacterized sulfatase